MPKTESEWQELSDLLAREVMKARKWEDLTEEEQGQVMVVKLKYHHHAAYWWQRDDETYRVFVMRVLANKAEWKPHRNICQAMLILRTLLAKAGKHAVARISIRPLPGHCLVTIHNCVATAGTPALFVRSPYVDNEMQAICLAAKEWCKTYDETR